MFADDLATRFEATLEVGRQIYGDPRGVRPGPEVLHRGFERLRPLLPPERLAAATADDVLPYGAWNAPVLFLGLSAGTQNSPLPREHEHVVGCPDFFERPPHAPRGNRFFPVMVREVCAAAVGRVADGEGAGKWLANLRARDPAGFRAVAGSALLVLNLTAEGRPSGSDPVVPPAVLARRLERHLEAYSPRVLVPVKPRVLDALRKAYPDAGLPPTRTGLTAPLVVPCARLGDHRIRVVTMPVHPNCKPPDWARYDASVPLVAEAIARGLVEASPC